MSPVRNELIASLADGRRIQALTIPVHLAAGDVLQRAGSPTMAVYFPLDARVSLLATIGKQAVVQVCMVGKEGLVGSELALGLGPAPLTAIVQSDGTALRATASAILLESARNDPLRGAIARQAAVTMRQLATSAACLYVHELAPRLARWLLMTGTCAGAKTFAATQHAVAALLGVRRPGVSQAAVRLQRMGLIDYQRGVVTLLDLQGLKAASCDCYKTDRQLHALLLQPLDTPQARV